MNETKFKPSLIVNSLLGDELARDSENFLLFLKAYYEWLQTTKLTIKSRQGTFQRNEVLIGQESGASAKIQEVGTDYLVVTVNTKKLFLVDEQVVGQTSSANAVISIVKDNVVRASGNFTDYRTIENSVDRYYDYLREELYSSIPSEYFGNKKLLAKNFRDYFESKGNEESYRFLFKILYNEPIEFYYPGQDVLRVSDGKFEKSNIIRTAVTPRIFEFLDKTIRGQTSNAIANVVDIKTFFIGSIEVAEFTVSLVSGTFSAYEDIVDIADETLITSTYGIIADFDIVDGGSGYVVGDPVVITGDGAEAQAFVSSIQDSPITAIKVNATGFGYRLGTTAIVNNSGTGGSDFILRVGEIKNPYTAGGYTVGEVERLSIINRGFGYVKAPTITLQDVEVSALGMLTEKLVTIVDAGTDYGVGNTLIISGGSGANAAGQVASVVESTTYDLLFEDDYRMLVDGTYEDIVKNEDWSVVGPIARIEFTNFGDGYTVSSLPTITVNTTTGSNAVFTVTGIQGQGANVTVDVSNNITGIGSIRDIIVTNFGINYSTANADVSASGDQNAVIEPIISGLGIKEGNWVGDDGKIDFKIIQDSFFYQDFSYAIRSALTFNTYKDTLLKTVHPAGLQPFGQILLTSFFNVSPNFVTQIQTTSPEIDTVLLQIRSFFSVAVSTPFSGSRMELELSRTQLNVEIANTDSRFIEIEINPELDVSFTVDKQVVITPTYEVLEELINTNREVVVEFKPELDLKVDNVDKQVIIQHGFEDLDVSSNFDQNEYVIKPTYEVVEELVDTDTQVIITPKYDPIIDTVNVDKQVVITPTYDSFNVESSFGITSLDYEISPEISVAIDNPDAQIGLSFNLRVEGPKYSSFQFKDVKIGNIKQYDPNNSDLIFNFQNVRFDDYLAPPTKISLTIVNEEIVVPMTYVDTEYSFIKKIESEIDFSIQSVYSTLNIYQDFNVLMKTIEIDISLASPIKTNIETKVQTKVVPFALSFDQNYKVEIEKEISAISTNSAKYVITPNYDSLFLQANTITQSFGNFANLSISKISFEPVSTFAGFRFTDPASLGSAIKNIKVTGTVTVSGNTVIGTGTLFEDEFSVNEFVIIDNSEKFIINNISNNSFMTLNLPASGSYTDVLAYKENL